MFISKLELKNFKRFTDLTIDLSGDNTPPKLVLMIGANGSGKSSVFDAFEWISQLANDRTYFNNLFDYHGKNNEYPIATFHFSNGLELQRQGNTIKPIESPIENLFYGRSALRIAPRLKRTAVSANIEIARDGDRPKFYIDYDDRFENDYFELINRVLNEVLNEQENSDTRHIRDKYLTPINEAMLQIFGNNTATSLVLKSFSLPQNGQPGKIEFGKGNATFLYDLLSSGEKEIFGILLNLLIRKEHFNDTIYFIDELDVHLNTALQYNLIKEILENWIPENCQLWTASHSLGFIQYAKEFSHAAILDFDQLDFDQPQSLTPLPKEVLEIYEVAVPRELMLKVFHGKSIFLCENKNDEYYNLLGLDEKIFVGVQDKRQVYLNAKNNPAYFGLMDRDYLTESEISKIRQQLPNLRILEYYAFENYLYHPENIAELFPDFDIPNYQADIVRQKNEQRDYILTGLELARRGYSVLNDENIERDKNGIQVIIEALQSDKLEKFYPYFDMKSRFNRHLVGSLKLTPAKLAQTNWFKAAISKILV